MNTSYSSIVNEKTTTNYLEMYSEQVKQKYVNYLKLLDPAELNLMFTISESTDINEETKYITINTFLEFFVKRLTGYDVYEHNNWSKL